MPHDIPGGGDIVKSCSTSRRQHHCRILPPQPFDFGKTRAEQTTDENQMKTPKNPTASKSGRLFPSNVMALAAALILPGTTAIGQSFWSGGTSDFNNAASWSGTYIGSSNPNCANDSGSNNVVLIEPGDPVWQHG